MSSKEPISTDVQEASVTVKEIYSEPVGAGQAETSFDQDTAVDKDSHSPLGENQEKSLQLPDVGGGYEIITRIGQGGMGAVYKARDRDGNLCAIKFLRRELAEDITALKRFEKEAESVSQLTHPNLVAVYEHGRAPDGVPFLVMEYLEGSNLGELLEREGNLSPERAVKTFLEICEGLIYAHQNEVIHRDIKPSNVIINQPENGDISAVRLVDFGISTLLPNASRETRELTQTGEVFGSPYYMSPEQCLGFMLDQRSDIYSFGCLMYETLTGKTPFAGSNPIQLVVKHINEEVAPFPQELKGSRLMSSLEQVVQRCLEKEQTLRYQTVEALKADLEKIRDGKPIPRYSTGKRAKPTLTKRQTVGAIALTFGVLFYICFSSTLISSSIASKIAVIMLGLIGAAGVYAFVSAGIERLRTLWRAKGTARQWFLMLILISIGMAGFAMAPFAVSGLLFDWSTTPVWMHQLLFVGHASHALWMILLCSSILGFIFTRSSAKIGVGNLSLRLGLSLLMVMGVAFACPQQSAKIPYALAETAIKGTPRAAIQLYKLSAWLDPQRGSLSHIAQLQTDYGDPAGALSTLESIPIDRRLPNDHQRLAILYKKFGKTDKAMAEVDSLITRNLYDSQSFKVDSYTIRGGINIKLGHYDEAEQDLNAAIRQIGLDHFETHQ